MAAPIFPTLAFSPLLLSGCRCHCWRLYPTFFADGILQVGGSLPLRQAAAVVTAGQSALMLSHRPRSRPNSQRQHSIARS
jgi:hypothetical protein